MTATPFAPAAATAAITLGDEPLVLIGEQHVASSPQCLYLTREHALKGEIVCVGGEKRRVGGQRNRGKRRPITLFRQPADEFRGDMLAIRGAAAVSAEQQLAAALDRLGDERCRACDVRGSNRPSLR
jgi:hypothetical protein